MLTAHIRQRVQSPALRLPTRPECWAPAEAYHSALKKEENESGDLSLEPCVGDILRPALQSLAKCVRAWDTLLLPGPGASASRAGPPSSAGTPGAASPFTVFYACASAGPALDCPGPGSAEQPCRFSPGSA